MSAPRVSLGMPVYNSRPAEFAAALESLLAQDFGDFEVILSDNGSSDEARAQYEAAARRDARIRYIRHPENHGAVFNFNFVFARARGELFRWCSDDDSIAPSYLRKTVALLDAHPDAVTAGSHIRLVDGQGRLLTVVEPPPRFSRARPSERVVVGPELSPAEYLDVYALHRVAALRHTHLSQAIHGADALMLMELLLQGTIRHVPEPLFTYEQPARYDMDGLALAMLGAQAKPMFFRYPTQHLALQMLVSAATIAIDLPASERAACLLALTTSMAWNGWFNEEARVRLQYEAAESVWSGAWLRGATRVAESLAWSPQSLLRPRDWRRLASIFRHHPRRTRSERGAGA